MPDFTKLEGYIVGRPFAAPKDMPSADFLNLILDYNATTGILTWKTRTPDSFAGSLERSAKRICSHWNNRFAGNVAGSSRKDGYVMLTVAGDAHMAHRIAWKMKTGMDPLFIDHINRLRHDNRFENLRDVSHQVNMKNKSLYKNSLSQVTGVNYHERDDVWAAKIGVDGGQVQLGSFDTKAEAIAARMAAEVILDYAAANGRSKTGVN